MSRRGEYRHGGDGPGRGGDGPARSASFETESSDDSWFPPGLPLGVAIGVGVVLAYRPLKAFVIEVSRIPSHTAGFLRGK